MDIRERVEKAIDTPHIHLSFSAATLEFVANSCLEDIMENTTKSITVNYD